MDDEYVVFFHQYGSLYCTLGFKRSPDTHDPLAAAKKHVQRYLNPKQKGNEHKTKVSLCKVLKQNGFVVAIEPVQTWE